MTSSNATLPTAAILTLGCKLNLADSEAMARSLRAAGWRVTESNIAAADVVIVNSCSITRTADRKSRHLVLSARRQAPEATIALTGCMVETAGNTVLEGLGVDLVARQPDQAQLVRTLVTRGTAVLTQPAPPDHIFRTRAFVSAQEGCNDVCAFCVVPRTRGRERSKTIAEILAEVRLRGDEGVQEVVLTGTQLGAYGRDRADGEDLAGLLAAVLRKTRVPRIRVSSVQPQDISPRLVDQWSEGRLCRHLHLALQSGSDSVLRRMRRRYDTATYREAILRLRAAIPGVAITTDVIAGFPGETAAEFAETLAFCREMAFAAMHVFPYSERAGTGAMKLPGAVPEETRRERVRTLIDAGEEMKAAYRRPVIGATAEVLWETATDSNAGRMWEGLTDTYIRVRAPAEADLRNRLTPVRLLADEGDVLLGEVLGAAG